MSPFLLTRATVSGAALVSLVIERDLERLATVAVGLFLVLAIVRGSRSCARLVGATLVMALPLFLVHGLLNPAFAVSESFHTIPWRGDGASYAALVSLRMTLLFLSVGMWMGLHRSLMLALIAGSRIPAPIGLALLQALVLSQVLTRRVASIRLAQKSRGVLREGNVVHRAAGAVAMVVPLIASTLIDAHDRGDALARLGFGSVRIIPTHSLPAPGSSDVLLASAVAVAVLVIIVHGVAHAY